VKKFFSLVLCALMLCSASLALAGGPSVAGCAPGPYYQRGVVPAGNPCAYWGDAPFPGLCGGVVALPFLVVGSLLGGNTAGPYGPAPYAAVPAPGYGCAPAPVPVRAYPPPVAPPACAPGYGPAYGAPYAATGNSLFEGLPCLELCSGLLGGLGGGFGFGM
jgi:hypothetical protein